DIEIKAGSTDTNAAEGSGNDGTWTPNGTGSSVGVDTINQRLNNGTNVTIKTASSTSGANQGGNITVSGAVNKTTGADTTLTLEADRNITINGTISATTGKLNLTLQGAGSSDGKVDIKKAVSLNRGDFKVQRAKDSTHALLFSSNQNITAHDISIEGYEKVSGGGVPVSITGGTLNATGAINITGVGAGEKGINLGGGATLNGSTINVNATSRGWEALLVNGAHLTATGDIVLTGTDENHEGIKAQGNAVLNSTGGNITLNGTSTKGPGISLNNATLNASSGDATLTANATGGNALTVSGGNITAGNISLNGTTTGTGGSIGVTVSNASMTATTGNINVTGTSTRNSIGSAASLDNATMTASSGNISVTGTGWDSGNGALYVKGGNFSALNTVMEGTTGRNNVGAKLAGNINVTTGNLAVTGTMKQFGNNNDGDHFTGLLADSGLNVNVSAGNLSLTGKVEKYEGKEGLSGATALDLTNVTLSAQHAELKGSNVFSGRGFVLSNVTLAGGINKGANTTFSSDGSSGMVTNVIGNGTLDANATEALMQAGIENNTQISVSGMTLGGSGDDWNQNYTSTKGGSWILDGATVSKTGNISLSGVGFVNSNITAGK
ncbi:hypothetical protein VY397_004515, partial [Salmonella enterica]|nr:hypothetical protein [Salmonella enterica]EME5571573.1 hypothetical protein [Salmonella enterica]